MTALFSGLYRVGKAFDDRGNYDERASGGSPLCLLMVVSIMKSGCNHLGHWLKQKKKMMIVDPDVLPCVHVLLSL